MRIRRQLVLVATLTAPVLAAAGCSYQVDDCNNPEEPFELDETLTARDVDRLIEQANVIDRNNLTCGAVCENIYLDMNPKGGATSVYNCTLEFDGEFNGDPEEVVGSMQCDGLAIPQFCRD